MKTSKVQRKGASTPKYVSPNQLTICGFETPFAQHLTSENRWVKLSRLIPWDKIVTRYDLQFKSAEGRPPISGRIVIGAVIIKHMLDLSDRETVLQIQENVFLQYFLGYSSFTNEAPFVASLFVEIRERLSLDILSSISDIVIAHSFEKTSETPDVDLVKDDKRITPDPPSDIGTSGDGTPQKAPIIEKPAVVTNKGKLLMDATVAPQNITYPTDLKLLKCSQRKE